MTADEAGAAPQAAAGPATPTTSSSNAPLASPGGSGTGKKRVLICLLRLDLRLHDNALFTYAHQTAFPPILPHREHFNRDKAPETRDLYSQSDYLIPLYVFDEREIELSGLPGYKRKGPEARTKVYGFWKTGAFRARFISESVYDLRSRLRDVGSDLMIRFGIPEEVVGNVVKGFQEAGHEVEGVWMQKEMTHDEATVEAEICKRLEGTGVPVRFVHGKTLVHAADLPHEISETPDVFTPFRKRVEALGSKMVRPTLRSPERFKPFPYDLIPKTPDYALDVSYEVDVDGLSDRRPEESAKGEGQISFHDILRYLLLPLNEPQFPASLDGDALLQQRHPASAFPLRGGESAALERLEWYFIRGKSADSSRWGKSDPPPVARYKQTRNNLLGHAYSTKMSPFLAYGSISPRQVWEALNYHERKFGEDQNTYWVRFELLWRDYFFFVAEKYGDLLFELGGFETATDPKAAKGKTEGDWWKTWDPSNHTRENPVTRLLEGRTGIPFIDANIIELRESGFMSNRGRQNVASFLTKDLSYDWRIGAEFFQSHLIDYDPTSNYGNWQYVAGVGNDPRASRQFNVIKQAKDYDSHGQFVKTWIPALRNLHPDHVHTPWLLGAEELRSYGVKATKFDVTIDGYPGAPVYEDETWKKHYERKEGVGSRMFGNSAERLKGKQFKKKPASARNAAALNATEELPFLPRRPVPATEGGPGGTADAMGGLSIGGRLMDPVSASASTVGPGARPQAGGASGPNNVIPPLRGARGSIGSSQPNRSNSPFGVKGSIGRGAGGSPSAVGPANYSARPLGGFAGVGVPTKTPLPRPIPNLGGGGGGLDRTPSPAPQARKADTEQTWRRAGPAPTAGQSQPNGGAVGGTSRHRGSGSSGNSNGSGSRP